MGLILDTNFVITAEREAKRRVAGRADAFLAGSGTLIGTNDLWIAATALVQGMGVITTNQTGFARVPGLVVIGY